MVKRGVIVLLVVCCVVLLSLAVVSTGSAREYGSNWTAQYYDNQDLQGSPVETRSGINGINFNFGDGKPIDDDDLDDDSFSIRFTSTQTFQAGTYEFVLASDDGARVYIDSELVLDRFFGRPLTTDRFQRAMAAGSHEIIVEYFEDEDEASVQFQWFLVSATGTPASQATSVPTGPTPTQGPPPTPVPTSLPSIPEGALAATVIRAPVLLVRSGPSLGTEVVGRVRRGQTYQVIGRDSDARWFLIQLSDRVGWVWHYYVYVNGNEFNAPVVSAFITQGNPAALTGVVGQTEAVMKLRAEPNVEAEQIGRIGWGDIIAIIGRSDGGDWYQVVYKGTTGWVVTGFVRIVEGDISTVPIVE